jgi:hypothetical protein
MLWLPEDGYSTLWSTDSSNVKRSVNVEEENGANQITME